MVLFSSEGTRADRCRKSVGVCANMWWVCREVGGLCRTDGNETTRVSLCIKTMGRHLTNCVLCLETACILTLFMLIWPCYNFTIDRYNRIMFSNVINIFLCNIHKLFLLVGFTSPLTAVTTQTLNSVVSAVMELNC